MQFITTSTEHADNTAIIMTGSGEQLSYGDLLSRVCRLANHLKAAGFKRGDRVAVVMENNIRFFEVYWATMISGMYYTPINRYLSAEEAAYIVNDCQANVLVSSAAMADVAKAMLPSIPKCTVRLMVDGACDGFDSYEHTVSESSTDLPENPMPGAELLYSSGTTGRPKGIFRPLPEPGKKPPFGNMMASFGISVGTVYLSPAPLYHAAPLGFAMGAQKAGATIVVMENFDPVDALSAIEKYRVTCSQWVPTMFTRMLKLPKEEREAFDLSHHKMAIHGAAPCPSGIKKLMIEWWGPILIEYYSSTEGNGLTIIDSKSWLEHPGSVGRPVMGAIHVCDDDGTELPTGEDGLIYFEQKERSFTYLNDEEKTRSSEHPNFSSWTALGDVGHVDEEGFLYLTDRKSELIISGGVNIYPAETEHLLITHEKISDVAVIGVPDDDFGESVMAIVQVADGVEPGPNLEKELIEFCKENLASYKSPRSIDFHDSLPRLPTGKLYKRLLRDQYWGDRKSRIV